VDPAEDDGALPRPLARYAGARTAAFLLWARLDCADRNGEFASGIPRMSKKQRRTALRGMVRQLGWWGGVRPTFRAFRKRISSASYCSMA